ncbi:MAG: HAD family hydrolase [Candidatus Omnitrophica bacterium]|nr:HAD family hydrolase [Candidatus Omnitrophota bacterium]
MEVNLKRLYELVRTKKAVFLDLDNTLYRYEECHRHALKKSHLLYLKAVERLSFPQFLKEYRQAQYAIHTRLEKQAASHSRFLYFQTLLEKRFGRPQMKRTLQLENIYWKSFLYKMRLSPWVHPFLNYCRSRKIKIAIVTNLTSEIQFRKILKLKLEAKVDAIVTSEEAGVEKPDARIYQLALKKTRCKPKEVLAVGDNLRTDKFFGASFYHLNQDCFERL